jgi:hypothetical protein
MNDRRQSPRIEILDRIHGHVVSLAVDLTVVEMSLGGMRVETAFPFPIGAEHEFRLRMGDDSTVVMRGRVLRCVQTSGQDGNRFVSGIQFLDEGDEAGVEDLLDKIK